MKTTQQRSMIRKNTNGHMRQRVLPSPGKQLRKVNMKVLGNRTVVDSETAVRSWWALPSKQRKKQTTKVSHWGVLIFDYLRNKYLQGAI